MKRYIFTVLFLALLFVPTSHAGWRDMITGSGGEWTDTGTEIYPTDLGRDFVIKDSGEVMYIRWMAILEK